MVQLNSRVGPPFQLVFYNGNLPEAERCPNESSAKPPPKAWPQASIGSPPSRGGTAPAAFPALPCHADDTMLSSCGHSCQAKIPRSRR